ncbi:hypothetical protein [Flagellimonas marinaquae]|jgi:hypothetical protein
MTQNPSHKFTPAGFIKLMSFLHMGIAATPIILGAMFYFNNDDPKLMSTDSNDFFLAIVPIVALASIYMGDLFFKKMLASTPKNEGLRAKLAKFQTASIIKYALLEGASLFSIVIFANTQNLIYLIIGAFLICYLFLQRPTRQKIEAALNLQGEEKAKFNRLEEPLI